MLDTHIPEALPVVGQASGTFLPHRAIKFALHLEFLGPLADNVLTAQLFGIRSRPDARTAQVVGEGRL